MASVIQRLFGLGRGTTATAAVAHSTRRDITKAPTDEEATADYSTRTEALGKMYSGTADWGTPIARNVVDVRAAFTLAGGIRPVLKETTPNGGASRELEWIEAFLDANGLRDDLPQEWGREAEIEGKFLAVLKADKPETGQIKARFFSYTSRKYTVEADPEDYATFLKVTYKQDGRDKEIKPANFVYRPFGGRTHNVNETPSKAASVVWNMEAIHKALYDWRKANRLFASPTPYFKCAHASEAKSLLEVLAGMKWKIGQFLAGTADYQLVGMPTTGIQSLKDEIVTNAQLISGNTGIPGSLPGLPRTHEQPLDGRHALRHGRGEHP